MRNSPFHVRLLALAALATLAACAASGDDIPGDDGGPSPAIGEIGGMCGGIAGFQCTAEKAYCKVEPGICREVADYAGVCAIKPEVCTKEYRPVCGCDGNTYSNACMAAVAGASIAHQGMCPDEDKS